MNIDILFLDLWLKWLVNNRSNANKDPPLKRWHYDLRRSARMKKCELLGSLLIRQPRKE